MEVVKKTFRYSDVFFYNRLYQPEYYYEKRYNQFLPSCAPNSQELVHKNCMVNIFLYLQGILILVITKSNEIDHEGNLS